MRHSETLANLAPALVKAHAEVTNALKDSSNPHFGSTFASLNSVIEAVKPVFTKHGLAIVQMPAHVEDGMAGLETLVVHDSGEWISQTASAPTPVTYSRDGTPRPPDAQSVGSVITYLRRYSLAAVAQIAQEDDDANAGSHEDKGSKASNKASGTYASVPCPKCQGETWDNRTSKTNPKAPDFKCKDRDCDGAIWMDGWEKDLTAEVEKAFKAAAITEAEKHRAEDAIVSKDPTRMLGVQTWLAELRQGAAA